MWERLNQLDFIFIDKNCDIKNRVPGPQNSNTYQKNNKYEKAIKHEQKENSTEILNTWKFNDNAGDFEM